MRHKKEHHEKMSHHKRMAKHHNDLSKTHATMANEHNKAIVETKRGLGQITGGELEARPHTARRMGEGVKSHEPMREKRKYTRRK